jgi:UDP-perosamine 4-acetyltransferase
MRKVAILGGGGHGRVVADALRALMRRQADLSFAGFIDRQPGEGGPWLGADEALAELVAAGQVTHVIIGVGATAGAQGLRVRLWEQAQATGAQGLTLVHPAGVVAPDVTLGLGTVVLAGAVVNTAARVGANAILNTGCIVEHDCELADHVHIAPGAVVCGGVRVGRLAMVGSGAVCLPGVSIGAGATVGAGAVVTADVGEGVRVAGVPAVPVS